MIVSSVIGFFLMILFGYCLFACFCASTCHASKKLCYPKNDYRYLPSCIRNKLRKRNDTLVSYPSTRSGLDRLEQAKLDQEMRRERIRLGEPIYEEIPLKGVAKLKKIFAKKKPVPNQTQVHVVQVHAPEISQPKTKKVSKLISFFSKKTPPNDDEQLKTYENYLTKARQLEKNYKASTRPKKTAGVHKPYVLTPSFVFGTGIEPAYDSFPLATWSRPNTTLKIAQSALDSGDVVLSFENETYQSPYLPTFETFKRVSCPKQMNPNLDPPQSSNPDLIELDPNQPEPNLDPPQSSNLDLIELDPNQPEQNSLVS